MKKLITIILIFSISTVIAQDCSKHFQFSDTILKVGQIKEVEIDYYMSGHHYPIEKSFITLDSIVQFLNNNKQTEIEIGTHTDYRGSEEYNLEISKQRAKSVKRYLILKGIEPERVKSVGYGESLPFIVDTMTNMKLSFPIGTIITMEFCKNLIGDEKFEIACELNRRTELKIIKNWTQQKNKKALKRFLFRTLQVIRNKILEKIDISKTDFMNHESLQIAGMTSWKLREEIEIILR